MKRIQILDIPIDNLSYNSALEQIEKYIIERGNHIIVFANPEIILMARQIQEYKEYIKGASLVLPDGIGLIWASKILKSPLCERVTGTDMVYSLAKLSQKKGYSLYFLGGERGVALVAKKNLEKMFPGVKIVGYYHGYFDENEEIKIKSDIKEKKPDILMVCLGMYKQEMWIKRNFMDLNVPVCFGNGGALDFVSGKRKRAFRWMQVLGLEWLFRLIQEPKRIKRQFKLIFFIIEILKHRLN